ncbi:unnamed protein product [Didymodactylos carnosus]|uniref:HTH cro/C1-type domain-containing protein n=1 Tax=Didymodactylos carnosus TaxID=1234261 RepID=A0A815HI68_9BILA|nr:unnamed protein product [Didymodactylos carnosus]CAF1355114.1 unnamed protein product [Didymodactylos carnosus]CAF4007155.1 unnamed protein product [Didymodactylos carnosus]CAF4228233.1 unnamed protein product [Didymodactylos carnosus]
MYRSYNPNDYDTQHFADYSANRTDIKYKYNGIGEQYQSTFIPAKSLTRIDLKQPSFQKPVRPQYHEEQTNNSRLSLVRGDMHPEPYSGRQRFVLDSDLTDDRKTPEYQQQSQLSNIRQEHNEYHPTFNDRFSNLPQSQNSRFLSQELHPALPTNNQQQQIARTVSQHSVSASTPTYQQQTFKQQNIPIRTYSSETEDHPEIKTYPFNPLSQNHNKLQKSLEMERTESQHPKLREQKYDDNNQQITEGQGTITRHDLSVKHEDNSAPPLPPRKQEKMPEHYSNVQTNSQQEENSVSTKKERQEQLHENGEKAFNPAQEYPKPEKDTEGNSSSQETNTSIRQPSRKDDKQQTEKSEIDKEYKDSVTEKVQLRSRETSPQRLPINVGFLKKTFGCLTPGIIIAIVVIALAILLGGRHLRKSSALDTSITLSQPSISFNEQKPSSPIIDKQPKTKRPTAERSRDNKRKKQPVSSDTDELTVVKSKNNRQLSTSELLKTGINSRSKPDANGRLFGFKIYNGKDTKTKDTPLPHQFTQNKVNDELRNILSRRDYLHALSKASKVDQNRIQRFLAGDRNITLDIIDRIANALDLSLIMVPKSRLMEHKDKHGFLTVV